MKYMENVSSLYKGPLPPPGGGGTVGTLGPLPIKKSLDCCFLFTQFIHSIENGQKMDTYSGNYNITHYLSESN